MANDYFRFKQFTIKQGAAAFKVTTDSVILGAWVDLSKADRVLDIGTGTGLLALMAAQRSSSLITAIEPDRESFLQAEYNISASPWADRISLLNCTLQDFVTSATGKFDVIISNPPYFVGSLHNPDPRKAMARHAATMPAESLIKASLALLSVRGRVNLVLPVEEGKRLIEVADKNGLWCNRLMYVKPTPHVEPKRVLMCLERVKRDYRESTLVIETGMRHCYSNEYTDLTKEFYPDR
jgi:tRNA1Val (adenine37-N6)-methyltransferase